MLEANTVNIQGMVTAQGADGTTGTAAGCGGGGGGSGGTIYISCSSFDIANGAFWINGGDGGDGGGTNGHGAGGGSGGHIKVFYETGNNSTGHHVAYSGYGTGDPYNGRPGGVGSGIMTSWWYSETFTPTEPYYSSGTMESAAYDTVYASTDFGKIHWCDSEPTDTELKFQIATNNDNTTWNFLGPDGTSGSYYTTSGSDIHSGHDDDRYIRYKAYFSTSEPGNTAVLSKVGITYTEGGITEVISFTVTDYNTDGIDFGMLDPGTADQPADGQPAQGTITLTIGSETNVDVNIQVKGDDFIIDGGGSTITIDNVKYDLDSDPSGSSAMTGSYFTWYSVSAATYDQRDGYHWISIPGGQTAGDYSGTFYYQAIKST
jgi:hypothetical protein